MPNKMLKRVDLPDPDCPCIPTNPLSGKEKDTRSKMITLLDASPYSFVKLVI